MKTMVKIPRELFDRAKRDLSRPHPFAQERVGFFSTRCTQSGATILVQCIAYNPVSDAQYVRDISVGARIGSAAITEAMSRSLNDSVGQLHVHCHGGPGLPQPSSTDVRELTPLSGSFANANDREVHGWMILGNGDAYTSLLSPAVKETITGAPVSIIGFPTTVNRRSEAGAVKGMLSSLPSWLRRLSRRGDRYSRQSFLGPMSEAIIAQAVVGVVGLGGGGSHIVQQLAHLGFKNFVLCDDDIISRSNLNRTVGSSVADVRSKRLKVAIAARGIQRLHKDANIISPGSRWEDMAESLLGCDGIVGCVDAFAGRRDLEAFCRRSFIPYLDVGMDVEELPDGRFEINGQVILSMPGFPCMHCLGFLNEKVLAQEAAKYGAAGGRPQVVWSNGVLCSATVGVLVDLLTDWSKILRHPVYLEFKGSVLSLTADKRLDFLDGVNCLHYPPSNAGDPVLRPL